MPLALPHEDSVARQGPFDARERAPRNGGEQERREYAEEDPLVRGRDPHEVVERVGLRLMQESPLAKEGVFQHAGIPVAKPAKALAGMTAGGLPVCAVRTVIPSLSAPAAGALPPGNPDQLVPHRPTPREPVLS